MCSPTRALVKCRRWSSGRLGGKEAKVWMECFGVAVSCTLDVCYVGYTVLSLFLFLTLFLLVDPTLVALLIP